MMESYLFRMNMCHPRGGTFLIYSTHEENPCNLCEIHSFPILAFTYTLLTIIFAPSSLKSCFSTGVSSVSGVSGVSGVSCASSVSCVSGVSGVSGALKKLAGSRGAWLGLF